MNLRLFCVSTVLLCVSLGGPALIAPDSPMTPTVHAQGKGWKVINKEDGVTVSQKEVEGQNLPIFSGKTTVNSNLYEVMAVLADFDRHKEWMHSCHTAKLLKKIDHFNRISYNRADAPWPVDDRDVVLRSKVVVIKNGIRINFKAIQSPLMKEVDGVVRMKRLKGFYQLTAAGPNKTRVSYQVNADPGGMLPDWLAEKAASDIPLNTLRNLRKRVSKVKADYKDFIKQWDPKYNPESPAPNVE